MDLIKGTEMQQHL